jgi:hypothetical protein
MVSPGVPATARRPRGLDDRLGRRRERRCRTSDFPECNSARASWAAEARMPVGLRAFASCESLPRAGLGAWMLLMP